MNIKTLFKVSVIASAMALVGCGGDIKIEPTVNDNSVDNSTNNSNNTDGGIDSYRALMMVVTVITPQHLPVKILKLKQT